MMNPDQNKAHVATFEVPLGTGGPESQSSPLARALRGFVARNRPHKIVEIGTGSGVNATVPLAEALRDNAIPLDGFYSIEIDAGLYAQACENLTSRGLHPHLLKGMSIPRGMASTSATYPDVVDDLSGYLLRTFTPDLVLFNASNSLGFAEFEYALSLIRTRCYVVLSDLYHIKGYRSLQMMQSDPRFQVLDLTRDHFGFCIAQFDPAA